MPRARIVCTVGTRPEAIKLAPVVSKLRRQEWADCHLVASGQHRQLLDETLDFFGLVPEIRLRTMRPGQALRALTARLVDGIGAVLEDLQPDLVLAAGDTSSVLASALASFARDIPFGHVEAGLRTNDLRAPYPEEAHRVLTARLASLHFAPTRSSVDNLLAEGVDVRSICCTGNPVIDALQQTAKRMGLVERRETSARRTILVTAHRRESFGEPLLRICRAMRELCRRHEDIEIVWPVHPNPAVRDVVTRELGDTPRVHLHEPFDYGRFVATLAGCYFVLTDSGGIQEEAPALGKPVLVLRDTSERPEAIAAGTAQLVGTDVATILAAAETLLCNPEAYARMSAAISPYGDGRAAARIARACRQFLASRVNVQPTAVAYAARRAGRGVACSGRATTGSQRGDGPHLRSQRR